MPEARGRRPRGPLRGRRPPQRNPRLEVRRGPGLAARAWRLATALVPRLLAGVVLGLAGLGALGLWQRLVLAEALRVRHVAVRGAERLGPDAVRALLGPVAGTPVLTLDLEALEARLRASPWVRHVYLARSLPDTLRVTVREHAPILAVSLGELYLADEDGTLFKRFSAADGLALPVLTGLAEEAPSSAPPEALAEQVRRAVALARAVGQASPLGCLQEIHWQEDTGWSIVSERRHRLGRIHLGAQPLGRVELAVRAVRALQERHQGVKVIWADGVKNPRRVSAQIEGGETTAGRRG